MKTTKPSAATRSAAKPAATPKNPMTRDEKEAFIAQTEEFEGPSRREIRGPDEHRPHDPGVTSS
jgi:hypothetical protein